MTAEEELEFRNLTERVILDDTLNKKERERYLELCDQWRDENERSEWFPPAGS